MLHERDAINLDDVTDEDLAQLQRRPRLHEFFELRTAEELLSDLNWMTQYVRFRYHMEQRARERSQQSGSSGDDAKAEAESMRTPKNFFNVGVRFKTHAYGIQDQGREGKVVTPEIVLAELEEFCQRVRADLAKVEADEVLETYRSMTTDEVLRMRSAMTNDMASTIDPDFCRKRLEIMAQVLQERGVEE